MAPLRTTWTGATHPPQPGMVTVGGRGDAQSTELGGIAQASMRRENPATFGENDLLFRASGWASAAVKRLLPRTPLLRMYRNKRQGERGARSSRDGSR
jgi:hypothetical protein